MFEDPGVRRKIIARVLALHITKKIMKSITRTVMPTRRKRGREPAEDTKGSAECPAVSNGLTLWVQAGVAHAPVAVMMPAGSLIDDLKPKAKKACSPLFAGAADVDLILTFALHECPEDAPLANYVASNSAKCPLVLSMWSKDQTPADLESKALCSLASIPACASTGCTLAPVLCAVATDEQRTVYMELIDGTSDKFYELKQEGKSVTIRYGRRGASGMISTKSFDSEAAASRFVEKTAQEKHNKGYCDVNIDDSATDGALGSNKNPDAGDGAGDPKADLEAGKKIFVQGSGKLPYALRKFNGGYSCSCPGFTMHIKTKGIQATTCKHLKMIRGEEAEALRCAEFSGRLVVTMSNASKSGSGNGGIARNISLAHAWKPSIDPTNFMMSEKLDGMRAYWSEGKLWTRSGGLIAAPDWFLAGLPAEIELDGELFLGRKMFDECMSIARRSDASGDWSRLSYVIFDAPKMSGGISARLAAIECHIDGRCQYARIHPHQVCLGMDHLLEELAVVEKVGGEGLMIRHPTAPHRGGRSNDLLKVKSFHDAEALVIAHEEGKGKYKNMVGSLVCKLKNGCMFKVGSGLADSERSYDSAPPIGSVITFKYFELTKDGIPRFPTFLRIRPDREASEF